MLIFVVFGISLIEALVTYSGMVWFGGKRWHLSPWLGLNVLLSIYYTFLGQYFSHLPLSEVVNGLIIPLVVIYWVARGVHGKQSYPSVIITLYFVNVILIQSAFSIFLTLVLGIRAQEVAASDPYTLVPLTSHIITLLFSFGFRKYYYRAYQFIAGFLKKATKSLRFIMVVQGVFLFLFAAIILMLTFNDSPDGVTATAIYMMAIFFAAGVIALVFMVNRILREHESRLFLSLQEQMQVSYNSVNDDIRGFWHSYANVMQVIKILVTTEHLEVSDVKDALEEFVVAHEKDQMSEKIKLIEIPNTLLACILSSKVAYAEELGVNLRVNVTGGGPIDLNMRILTEILGILLDNAIEVAVYADQLVEVSGTITDSLFQLTIVNGVTREGGSVKKHSKSNGIGLKRVETLASKHSHIRYTAREIDSVYTVNFEVRKRWQ